MLVSAALLSWFLVGLFIRISKARGWGQPVRKEGPQTHLIKEGTPSGGGIAFFAAMLLMFTILAVMGQINDPREWLIIMVALGMGIIGGLDDFFKIRSRMRRTKTKELLARYKLPMQIAVALIFSGFASTFASHQVVPKLGGIGDFPIWDILLMSFVMVGSVNAFNFTDGTDGLLAGVACIVLLPLLAISPSAGLMIAVLLGFLWFNAYPARVFMGDMGSHAIGAVAAAAYMLYVDVWLLPVAAFIPVLAVLSVIIQVLYFRRTGKRFFKMSPIHHHFELSGWPETHVALRFWVVTALTTALTWWIMGGRP